MEPCGASPRPVAVISDSFGCLTPPRGPSKCVAQRHSASQKLAQAADTMGLVGHSGNQLSHPRRSFSPLQCLGTLGTWIARSRICMSQYYADHTPHQCIPTAHATSPRHDTTPVTQQPHLRRVIVTAHVHSRITITPTKAERAACCERERVHKLKQQCSK